MRAKIMINLCFMSAHPGQYGNYAPQYYLPNVHFRAKKCYNALVLATGNLVRRNKLYLAI